MALAVCFALWAGPIQAADEAAADSETWVMLITPGRPDPASPPTVVEFRGGRIVTVAPRGLPQMGAVAPAIPGAQDEAPPPDVPGPLPGELPHGAAAAVSPFAAGATYTQVYNSIPFVRSEYEANPSYRHEATMEIVFGQLRPTVVQKPLPPVAIGSETVPPFWSVPPLPSFGLFGRGPWFARPPLPFWAWTW